MITIRKSGDRGHANHGWLDTHHTFSFADYYDPRHTGFSDLLVINEDHVAPGKGFGRHGHRDMEIVTFVITGQLEHSDSSGGGSVLKAGDVQHMSAGTGVLHSEFNPSQSEPVHLLQIWIEPDEEGIEPGYQDLRFAADEKRNVLRAVVSGRPAAETGALAGVLRIHQDATIYASWLDAGKLLQFDLEKGRHAWIQLISGSLRVNEITLGPGDGAAVGAEVSLKIFAETNADFLLFDLR